MFSLDFISIVVTLTTDAMYMLKRKTHVGSDPLTVYVKSVPILTSLLFPRQVIHTLDYPPIMFEGESNLTL